VHLQEVCAGDFQGQEIRPYPRSIEYYRVPGQSELPSRSLR
jgi:hypothetical protein